MSDSFPALFKVELHGLYSSIVCFLLKDATRVITKKVLILQMDLYDSSSRVIHSTVTNYRFVWPRDLCYVRYWRRNDDGSYGKNLSAFPLLCVVYIIFCSKQTYSVSSILLCSCAIPF